MAAMFELFIDAQAQYRFRLRAPDGTVMAVSKGFVDKPAAVVGIRDVRAYAGMGLIADLCPGEPPVSRVRSVNASSVVPEATVLPFRKRVRRSFLTRKRTRLSARGPGND